MSQSTDQRAAARSRVLATDLDGTLIPLGGDPRNIEDLRTLEAELRAQDAKLLFVTGRHLSSVEGAIGEFSLPRPDAIICDVGTTLCRWGADGTPEPVEAYSAHLREIVGGHTTSELRGLLQGVAGLTLQEEEKLGEFKLSYYVDADRLDSLVEEVRLAVDREGAPYSIIGSVDPFNGDGLIDLLPTGVSKAHALRWWADEQGLSEEQIVFSGDSGNDLAALTSGFRAIVVGNASDAVAQETQRRHREAGWRGRLYFAEAAATSGVLEGCRWFGLAGPTEPIAEWLGAQPLAHDQTAFRVWAPKCWAASVQIDSGDESPSLHPLEREPGGGYHSGVVDGAGPGTRYRYLLDDDHALPDPASRRQPDGVHGPSEVVAPRSFRWSDRQWRGVAKRDLIIYELHVGAFTAEGTFRAAIERIPELVELGVTAVELLPVVQTPGAFNWGYDGVNLFAARNTYGEPDDLKSLVDACHAAGLAVLLDVVYNHVGPEGNYLPRFGPYSSRKHRTPWGDALNFDGKDSAQVRRFVVDNALFWLDEYHLDGLRLDAAYFMVDESDPHILDDLRRAVTSVKQSAEREVHLIAETNAFDGPMLVATEDRAAYDAIWCDCFMHAVYSIGAPEFRPTTRDYHHVDDLAVALSRGFLYEGSDFRRSDGAARGDIESLVTALQTHDAVGNHPRGFRLHQLASREFQAAAAALSLLHPSVPLLFMGEESAVDAPFPFFADFEDRGIRRAVVRGRRAEYPGHDWLGAPSPVSKKSFELAKSPSPTADNPMRRWYQQLVRLRKRGIAEGWLAAERFSARYDSERDAFWMQFAKRDGGAVSVYARLNRPAKGGEDRDRPLDDAGRVLLSSRPDDEPGSRVEALSPNHAVVVESS